MPQILREQPINVRTFRPDDYESVVFIHNSLHSDRPTTSSTMIKADQNLRPDISFLRLVAEKGNEVVGSALYCCPLSPQKPDTARIVINVLPKHQRQGIGTALYDEILAALKHLNPKEIKANAYEKPAGGIPFLEKHGFVITFRERKCILDPRTFDRSRFAGIYQKCAAEGIEFLTMIDVEEKEENFRQLCDLEHQAMLDIPGVTEDELGWPDFKTWKEDLLADPNFRKEMYFIARKGQKIVGMSVMTPDTATNAVYQWLTGVSRDYRRKGIATTLKAKGISFAQDNGYTLINNSTSVDNNAILSLNEKLGFQRSSEWVDMIKKP